MFIFGTMYRIREHTLVNAQGEEVFANKTHCHHQHNKVVIQKMANSPAAIWKHLQKQLQQYDVSKAPETSMIPGDIHRPWVATVACTNYVASQ